ncbi:unnamed protein product [Schistosoma spindalis]|nr:unnamed protein product [Schistosoma spindale]
MFSKDKKKDDHSHHKSGSKHRSGSSSSSSSDSDHKKNPFNMLNVNVVKNAKKINPTLRIKKKTIIVITNRVQNIVLGHRLLHHRILTIKRSKSHGINENETFFQFISLVIFSLKLIIIKIHSFKLM